MKWTPEYEQQKEKEKGENESNEAGMCQFI